MADRAGGIVAACVWAAAILVTAAFGWILFDLLRGGLSGLSWEFLTSEPRDAGRAGGIGTILVSTIAIVFVCIAVAVPISLGTAILLAELTPRGGRFGRAVRFSLDVLAGMPSIVFGLFGSVLFCKTLGLGFSILSGGLTLACMTLPLLIRSIEAGLRTVPEEWRHGAAALGISRTSTILELLVPAAAPGLAVGLVLGIGRAMAETAALIFTSGYVARAPSSLLDSGRALSVHIYELAMNVPGSRVNVSASALVLLLLLLVTGAAATWLAEHWLGRKITTP